MDLNYENHLEVHLIKNPPKPPPPPENNWARVVVAAVLVFYLFIVVSRAIGLSIPRLEEVPQSSSFWNDLLPDEEPLDDLPQVVFFEDVLPFDSENSTDSLDPPQQEILDSTLGLKVQINDCNGMNYAGANFRDYPALTPLTIRGVVPEGEWVTLTGVTTYQDGITWYRAVNDVELVESIEPSAQNRTRANQVGWIAACFLD